MIYYCCDKVRRNKVRETPGLNGIDFLEVVDNPEDPFEERQVVLNIHFINNINPGSLTAANVIIEGGVRFRDIKVVAIWFGSVDSPPSSPPDDDRLMSVRVNKAGDFSEYRLRLIDTENDRFPPEGYDPILSFIDFSFKVKCNADFDCKEPDTCNPPYLPSPEINYLAKDYASFRQVMLDRMAQLMPDWKERNPADLGIALVELLAYVGDYLSYAQDAIATEAYLSTARKRISVRRLARLIDYFMHDGSNARVWVQLQAAPGINGLKIEKQDSQDCDKILTRTDINAGPVISINSKKFQKLIEEAQVFELMHDITLYHSHNEMPFYTWGDRSCCLPKGSTSASLAGDFTTLLPGDVIVLAEVLGAGTGAPEDADPSKRHAVRITNVRLVEDPLFDDETSSGQVTIITWHQEDALPFPMCISADTDQGYTDRVSLAFGNIVLADHGRSVYGVELIPKKVPQANPILSTVRMSGYCVESEPEQILPRYNPYLSITDPITQAAPLPAVENESLATMISAKSLIKLDIKKVEPQVKLIADNHTWTPARDLLNSFPTSREFVLETENNGRSSIRFGNNIQGLSPEEGLEFIANCRIGNGIAGNIGRDRLAVFATNNGLITKDSQTISKIWNPLPASGGLEPESIEHVRQHSPNAFKIQERAVITEDYEDVSLRCRTDIQRVKANHRWTGSWYTVFVATDRLNGLEVDEAFETEFRKCLEKYRMAGYDLEVETPLFVPLLMEAEVCLEEGYFPAHVKAAVLDIFNRNISTSGQIGLFHPDRFTFGQPVYLSPFIAAANAVKGVKSVNFTRFQKLTDKVDEETLKSGKIEMSRNEIARLDNDPNFPENGQFKLTIL